MFWAELLSEKRKEKKRRRYSYDRFLNDVVQSRSTRLWETHT